MRWVLVGMLIGAFGCGQTQSTVVYKGITDPAMRVEEQPLPDRPDKDPLTEAQNQSYPLVKGSAAPIDGVVITPEKAARVLKLKAAYDEIRAGYTADKTVFAQNRLIYEERLQQANAEISRISPSWWDKHGAAMSALLGVIAGALVTVGLYRIATGTK